MATFGLLALILGALIAYMLGIFPPAPERLDPRNKAVVVTGCDTGFGFALAAKLDDIGFTVFAGCLDIHGEGARRLQEGASSRLLIVQMDVTRSEELVAALETVKQHLPEPGQGR